MNKWLFIFCILLLHSCGLKQEEKDAMNVGDIPFDKNLDDPNFITCNESLIPPYYAFQNPSIYEGEKPALNDDIISNYEADYSTNNSGYITVRFIVNCQAKTGRFRVETLDFDYKSTELDPELVEDILNVVKGLDGWIPASYNDQTYDYYKYLTFKIINNQINSILP